MTWEGTIMNRGHRLLEGRLIEEARELPVAGEFDVVVAGGGLAGLGAAV